jgi:D-glutamate cyclase
VVLETFPATFSALDEARYQALAESCDLLISCERAGPGRDGNCYTMRGINMTERGLIAPLHRLVRDCCKSKAFLAVGDGGNELGMGKVIEAIRASPKIQRGDLIGCVTVADHLIAASVSNWGGYALAAATAVVKGLETDAADIAKYVDVCLPTEHQEIDLLNACVAAGCRDGVSGKMEATVDGMALETSLHCLRDIRKAVLERE